MAYFKVFFTAFCCFIFYIHADAACPSGWTSSCSGTCLRYYDNHKTYNRASAACKQLGAELVTLETRNKIIFFRGYRSIIGRFADRLWIGAHKYYGYWKWDGLYTGRMTVTDWKSGEPNNNGGGGDEDCVETHHSGGWNDCQCHGNLPYVCEKYE